MRADGSGAHRRVQRVVSGCWFETVRARGPRHDVSGERGCVIGADDVERVGVSEREVQQALVDLAFDDLVCGAGPPKRFADATDRPRMAVLGAHEVVQHRDDAAGVPADDRHVRECDAVGRGPQPCAQRAESRFGHRDEHCIALGDPGLDEGDHVREEVGVAAVEEGLVSKRAHFLPPALEIPPTARSSPFGLCVKRARSRAL